MSEDSLVPGHAFLAYVREDSPAIDQIQRALESAGIRVWRDTADLWPGEDWRVRIRAAITGESLAFIACFSRYSVSRQMSYQNEELLLAIEQLRQRAPGVPWLIPVRLDDCVVPDLDIGGGRTLASIQRVDVFGAWSDEGTARLVAAVLRILSGRSNAATAAQPTVSARTAPPERAGRPSRSIKSRNARRISACLMVLLSGGAAYLIGLIGNGAVKFSMAVWIFFGVPFTIRKIWVFMSAPRS